MQVKYGPHVCQLSETPAKGLENKIRALTEYEPEDLGFMGTYGGAEKKRYLYNKRTRSFPTGLLHKVMALLPLGTELVDADAEAVPVPPVLVGDKQPRYYQKEAHEALVAAGRGVAVLGTGTGKTLLCSMLAKSYPKQRVLVTTPNRKLLHQNRSEMTAFMGESVGILGDAEKELESRVVVATIQSLMSKIDAQDPETLQFLGEAGVWICDESHGAAADSYRTLSRHLVRCHVRLGTTATWMREDGCELIMEGILGDVVYDYPYHQAFADRFLTPIQVLFREIEHPFMRGKKPHYSNHYRNRLVANFDRNLRIALDAATLVDTGQTPCLVLVRQHEHGKHLANLIGCPFIKGDDTSAKVDKTLASLVAGEIPVLVASGILNVGVNLPNIKSAINASGGDSRIEALQKPGRGLRLYPGKDRFIYIDYYDQEDFYFKWHSANRKTVYIKFFQKVPRTFRNAEPLSKILEEPPRIVEEKKPEEPTMYEEF